MRTKICEYCQSVLVIIASDHRKRFCDHSCAAKYHNASRKKIRKCIDCDTDITGTGKYCETCRYVRFQTNFLQTDYSTTTIRDLREKYGNAGMHAKIRGHARSQYKRSKLPMQCKACGYDLHVDICHIKDVQDFPEDTIITEVNSIKNLVALDKRCHWEFDNGYLKINGDVA